MVPRANRHPAPGPDTPSRSRGVRLMYRPFSPIGQPELTPAGQSEIPAAWANGQSGKERLGRLETALALRKRGFWVILTRAKKPIGKAWGVEQWAPEKLKETHQRYPDSGPGICLGP